MKISEMKKRLEEYSLLQPSRFYQMMVGGKSEEKMRCPNPDHEDSTPSFNWSNKGFFKCFGCDWRGKSPLALYIRLRPNLSLRSVLEMFYNDFIEPTINISEVDKFHNALMNNNELLEKLQSERFILTSAIKKYKVGWDGSRFTIPVFNELGFCVDLRRAALLKSLRSPNTPKVLAYKKGYGKVRLLGTHTIHNNIVYYVEGEPDMLSLASVGAPVITNTNGVNSWKEEWLRFFRGKQVVIFSDVGAEDVTKKKAESIASVAASVHLVTFKGKESGYDVNDFILENRDNTKEALRKIILNAERVTSTGKSTISETVDSEVSFSDLVSAENFMKRVKFRAFVVGKALNTYLVTRSAKVICKHQAGLKKCKTCPLASQYALNVSPYSQEFLKLLETRETEMLGTYADLCGAPRICRQRIEVEPTSVYNVSIIKITHPQELVSTGEQREQSEIVAYTVGDLNIIENNDYDFSGIVVQHPKTQQATVVIDKAVEGDNPLNIDNISDELMESVKTTFSKKETVRGRIKANIESVKKATGIVGRDDMIYAMLVAYHTVRSFEFAGQLVERGTGDVLFIGDTRTGKTELVSSFIKGTGIGKIIQAENTSFAGIMGGAESLRNHRWMASWGIIPTNNRKLVVLDEASKLNKYQIAKLRGVRSSAIAQINKISISVTTPANTRLIWICNPREGQTMSEFAYGIQSIRMLTDDPADISRFDAVVVVRSDEVNQTEINKRREINKDELRGFASRIKWIWSLDERHVRFTEDAEKAIFKMAETLNDKYHCDITLFESDSYVKVAKVAVAIAAITLTETEGKKIVVTEEHAKEVEFFYDMIYDKVACDLSGYAAEWKAEHTGINVGILNTLLDYRFKNARGLQAVMAKLMKLTYITEGVLARIFAVKKSEVDNIINTLYTANAIVEHDISKGIYKKTPAFSEYLRRRKKEAKNEESEKVFVRKDDNEKPKRSKRRKDSRKASGKGT